MKKILSAALAVITVIFVLVLTSCGYGTHHVEITFENYGTVKLELYGDVAPITVKNFIKLAKSGYYDGTNITRIEQNFVIQGGKGAGTDKIKGEFLLNGVENTISHKRGVISMARSDTYDSASDQFFICLSDNAAVSCDYRYAAFGIVTEGMEIIDQMAKNSIENVIYKGFLYPDSYIKITSVKVID
ncbi:MAG: peptidylprolyl isomerase [Clostridia bacterium]|nr:peptidylprolyl isomerase [Clostridia bacterium]